jgi:hypothetical protein
MALLSPWASSAIAEQTAQPLAQQGAQRASRSAGRQIAANDSTSGTLVPGAGLGAPGAGLGGPGTGMAPQGADAGNAPAPGAPGAALAPKDGAAPGQGPAGKEGMGGDPTQSEINEKLLYEHVPPTRVRIAVVNATGKPDGAAKVAVLLSEYRRRPLEDKLGLKIDLVNISTGYDRTQAPAVVYYRPGFLRAALLLAQAIPGDTMVSAMRPQALKRAGMDVEVVVGEALP